MGRRITVQEKRLKAMLKELGIAEYVHLEKFRRTYKNPETNRTERFTEYGFAYAVLLTDRYPAEKLAALRSHPSVHRIDEVSRTMVVYS
jgi:hypothetical protein